MVTDTAIQSNRTAVPHVVGQVDGGHATLTEVAFDYVPIGDS